MTREDLIERYVNELTGMVNDAWAGRTGPEFAAFAKRARARIETIVIHLAGQFEKPAVKPVVNGHVKNEVKK